MSSLLIAAIACVSLSIGVQVGLFVRGRLPEHHLRDESKESLKMATALIGTLTALILGLLVSSAKSNFDAISTGITRGGAKIISLDRLLAQYGPETRDAREQLRRIVTAVVARQWPEHQASLAHMGSLDPEGGAEGLHEKLRNLTPHNESQAWLKSQALQLGNDLTQLRWQLIEQEKGSLPIPLLAVLVFGLTLLFASFGLFAPRNPTVMTMLLLCALSVAGVIFIMLELDMPMEGMMKVSGTPFLDALAHLGQ